MCNSAYFGSRRRISTLDEAVMFLGQENILRAVNTAGAATLFKTADGYGVTSSDLWKHSVGAALVSQIVLRRVYQRDDPVLFTAVLMHDIGKIILGQFVNRSYLRISALVRLHGYSFLKAEEEIIGINHAELGGRIAKKWNFPQMICDVITYHHDPDKLEGTGQTAPWVAHLADQICLMVGIGGGSDGLAYRGLRQVISMFGLKQKDIEHFMMLLTQELQRAEEILEAV
jgi:putative nucleotidyltransferase with HDIG domain